MAANLLWAHLLRKDATTTDTPSQIPPIVPQDRMGTSMRMLIHDTQVNLEKFSDRLDGLLQRVEDCRAQVVNANKLLDVERDKVLAEIVTIANRHQVEMKAHVGAPAQATALDLVHVSQVSTEKSVQALEKRIDALQTLLQTHAHTMQSIQDQQNALMGAILPLVPIVHSVPPQMEQIKAGLSDMVTNAVLKMTNSMENVRSTLVSELAHGHGRAGSSTRIGSSSNKSTSGSRRKRSNASALGPQDINVPPSSPLASRSNRGPHLSLKRARIEGTAHHAGNSQLPQRFSRLAVPATHASDPPSLLQAPQTPRRPLVDLLFPPGSDTSRAQRHMVNHTNSASHEYMHPLEALGLVDGPSTTPVSRSFFRPPDHPLPGLQGATVTQRRPAALHDIPFDTDKSAVGLPSIPRSSDRDNLSKAIKIEELLEPKLTGVFSIHSSPLSSPPSSAPPVTRNPGTSVEERYMSSAPQVELVEVPRSLFDPITSNSEVSPPKPMSLRDRRAQMSRFGRTETRRFIPLVPWSDEEE